MTGSNAAFGFRSASPPDSAEVDHAVPRTNTETGTIIDRTQNPESSAEANLTSIDLDRAWEKSLRQVGLELKQVREHSGISLDRLHSLTYIPLPHLNALETGNLEKLPPDVYVRGFILRIGDALGLDGASLAASLPERNVMATRKDSGKRSLFALLLTPSPIHLYVGYAALLVAAFVGLVSLSANIAPTSSSSPSIASPIESDR